MNLGTIRRLSCPILFGATIVVAAPVAAQEVYKIGLVSPLSGANARYGAFANKGANLAAKEINAAGGVLGKKLELVSGDSQCVPAEGVSATKRMISFDKLPIVIGDICSSVTLAMQPLAEKPACCWSMPLPRIPRSPTRRGSVASSGPSATTRPTKAGPPSCCSTR